LSVKRGPQNRLLFGTNNTTLTFLLILPYYKRASLLNFVLSRFNWKIKLHLFGNSLIMGAIL